MIDQISRRSDRTLLTKTVSLVILGAVLFFGGTFAFLIWSTYNIDEVSVARQTAIARHVTGQLRSRIAHDQESVTVWDDAVEAVRAAEGNEDRAWIELNLGSWMMSYFGHDAAFIVSPTGKPIYALVKGRDDGPAIFQGAQATIAPMLDELRERLRRGDEEGLSERILSIGVSDYRFVDGHPAIVSLKPIVSDSGTIEQVAGEEYIHVAFRFLDSDFLHELTADYGFSELRFSPARVSGPELAELPLVSKGGEAIGYFVWRPYRPGLEFLKTIMPGLLVIAGLLIAMLAVLTTLLYRRVMTTRTQAARIRYIADHDGLTGLLNRASFERRLDDMLLAAAPAAPQLAVLYLDLDRFKQINDSLGHAIGDGVLREAARRIQTLLPPRAHLCRAGGDEFNLFLPYGDVEQVQATCASIIAAIQEPFVMEGHQAFVGISIGAAIAPMHGTQRVELTRKADIALYSAKASGRGTYALFGAQMDAIVRERAETERDLRLALDDKQQFEVLYQPKYEARSGEIASVEALVRWHHPTRGLMAPNAFIPIAEETGLVRELGRFVLEEACRDAVVWPLDNVAVNVSVVQLRDPFFAMTVVSVLGATGLDPRKLELEVTETAWADESEECGRNIKALRDMGVRIALDDFGTGFSTFGRLQVAEVDHIKIDKVFIDGLGKSHGDEAIVQAIIELARAKGLRTTAEGVETAEQNDFLTRAGCDDLQGFLFSRPIPRAEIELLLGKGAGRANGGRAALRTA